MTEDIEKLVKSGEWTVGVWDLQFYLYNNETAEGLKDHKGKVRIFGSEIVADEIICPDVEDLEEVWIPDIKKSSVDTMNKDRKRITLDQLREWVGNEGYPQHEQDMCNHFLEILNGDYKVEECRSDVLGYFGNSKEDILADKDQQAEDDYWDNHPEEAKRPPIDENLEKVILGAFKKVFPERFTPTDTSDVDVVGEDLMWVGFKDYDIRIEKDPEFNDGHLQISVHSKKDDGYMLHQDGEPCKLIVREENENE